MTSSPDPTISLRSPHWAVSSHIRAAVMPCFAHQMLARATVMSDVSDRLVCKVPARRSRR